MVVTYRVAVPGAAIAGDTAQLAIEADGAQLSHAQARLLPPAAFSFEDAVSVRVTGQFLSRRSVPATIPVRISDQAARSWSLLRNNAPEIRTFDVEFTCRVSIFRRDDYRSAWGRRWHATLAFRVFSSSADSR